MAPSATLEASKRARTRFLSPDRFLSPRPEGIERESVFRASKSPQSLSPRERSTRQRDREADPFNRTSPSRSQEAVRVRSASLDGRHRPPHFTPSFVHDNDASPGPVGADNFPDATRQISVGAVWNVGGPTVARAGPRLGVQDGYGGLLASGTNGPMHTADFLVEDGSRQDIQHHQDRLALALDIDYASRVLAPISMPLLLQYTSPESSQRSPFTWRNGTWSREEGSDRKFTLTFERKESCTDSLQARQKKRHKSPTRSVPALPFRVLDAPQLRDDFYCSPLAYSHSSRTLAVGLSGRVYLWSEELGVRFPPLVSNRPSSHVTCLTFSSEEGGKAILAVGRQSGLISLVRPSEAGRPRFQIQKSSPISCLAFKPIVSLRASRSLSGLNVPCEDLLVGDDAGDIHYYAIEWPAATSAPNMSGGHGHIVQLAKVVAHSQQICGLAWSPDGRYFATGGNDNSALLFEVAKVLQVEAPTRGRSPLRMPPSSIDPTPLSSRRDPAPGLDLDSPPMSPERESDIRYGSLGRRRSITPRISLGQASTDPAPRTPPALVLLPPATNHPLTPPTSPTRPNAAQPLIQGHVVSQPSHTQDPATAPTKRPSLITHSHGIQTHTFPHSAAVKAIAFAPWQPSLLATGGGSNDRQIHFFHTISGATLALINVFAQVTSLIWSKTKREVCATFGYAQPDHGVRIAVFAWPSSTCVVSIPWRSNSGVGRDLGDGGRALWAVAFPGGPNDDRGEGEREGQRWGSRTQEEGCIVVAGSDETVKFHEVWTGEAKRGLLGNSRGVLGGSLILEAGQGVDELSARAVGQVIR